ncbi:hypothetical protein C8Q74DRAFT_1373400 [Fomes fomentarius]|nr:hypothetical protein C8Q74DRAFT_1373400 [Fomes fomentarius]
MSLHECPIELLERIVQHIPDESTLRCMRAVDRTFCKLATPRAFGNVYVANSHESAVGLRSLRESPHLHYVKTIVVRCNDYPNPIVLSPRASAPYLSETSHLTRFGTGVRNRELTPLLSSLEHLTISAHGVGSFPPAPDNNAVERNSGNLCISSSRLDSCPMYVDANEANAPEHTWGNVCERFHDELQARVDLRISLRTHWGLDQMHTSDEVRLTYERSPLTGVGYTRGERCAAYEAADRPTLDKLLSAVQARKNRLGQPAHPDLPYAPMAATTETKRETEALLIPVV